MNSIPVNRVERLPISKGTSVTCVNPQMCLVGHPQGLQPTTAVEFL